MVAWVFGAVVKFGWNWLWLCLQSYEEGNGEDVVVVSGGGSGELWLPWKLMAVDGFMVVRP
jgi:hypothetical protein